MTGAPRRTDAEIAVIGAGVIGLTIALRLAASGREVVVIDPEPPGSGASWGNAGTISDYAVDPVGSPAVIRDLPRLLFDRNSPLAIRRATLPALVPWLARFLRQSMPGAARRNSQALAGLLADAGPLWRELAGAVGGTDLMRADGCLYWYRSDAGFRAAGAAMAGRRRLGVAVEMLDAPGLAALEPALAVEVGGAAFFPSALFLTDPGEMMARLVRAAAAAGARFERAAVHRLERDGGGVRLSAQPDRHWQVGRVVIAAGARSRRLAAMAGDRVPLDTERGYHLEWDMVQPRLNRPVCPVDLGFYLCPMTGRLRAAGTVELGGLDAPPSAHRLARLGEGVARILPDLGAAARSWMGLRPSMPDSLPVIGPSRAGAEILHAYGHGHIGLTLAPKTADLIALVVEAGQLPPDAVAVGRFRESTRQRLAEIDGSSGEAARLDRASLYSPDKE